MDRYGPRSAALVTAAALLLALGASAAVAVDKPTEPGQLTLIKTAVGDVVADKKGNPLYVREADKRDVSGCTGACTKSWPAAVGFPKKAKAVTAQTSQTKKDAPGSDQPQVILNTHPLYYFKNDMPNRPRGQNVPGFSLIAGDGRPLSQVKTSPTRTAKPARTAKPSGSAKPRGSSSPAQSTGVISNATSRVPAPARTAPPAHPRPPLTVPKDTTAKPKDTTTKPKPARTAARKPAATPPAPRRTAVPPPATRSRTAAPARPATTAPAVVPPAPVTTRTASSSVGALQVTPSGGARGGAQHPVDSAAAQGPSRAASLSLAVGTTLVAAAASTVLVMRGRRRSRDGRH
ncbi:hypothetical protein [Streptomyces liangshanensis]|uniref:hypothetical protein n=1 Tax=Streptomyces liangshanensis TaxID=2717324 RepID=UPI0036DC4B82